MSNNAKNKRTLSSIHRQSLPRKQIKVYILKPIRLVVVFLFNLGFVFCANIPGSWRNQIPTTNGDITFLVLPGNIRVALSGYAVRHADGRQLQRVGIEPNIRVVPTIRGIIAGKDEILNAAVVFLQKGK